MPVANLKRKTNSLSWQLDRCHSSHSFTTKQQNVKISFPIFFQIKKKPFKLYQFHLTTLSSRSITDLMTRSSFTVFGLDLCARGIRRHVLYLMANLHDFYDCNGGIIFFFHNFVKNKRKKERKEIGLRSGSHRWQETQLPFFPTAAHNFRFWLRSLDFHGWKRKLNRVVSECKWIELLNMCEMVMIWRWE